MKLSSKLRVARAAAFFVCAALSSQLTMAAECDITVLGDCARALIPERSAAIVRATKSVANAVNRSNPTQNRVSPSTGNTSTQHQRLSSSARCLEGSWNLTPQPPKSNESTIYLTITEYGSVYINGTLIPQDTNSDIVISNNIVDISYREQAGRMALRAKLDGDVLAGTIALTPTDRGNPPGNLNLRGTRRGTPPNECVPKAATPSAQTRERGSSIAEGLNNLSQLYTEGLLSEEEFTAAKRNLLGL